MEYNFRKIEKYWQGQWQEDKVYQVSNDSSKPKCYVLDMFPYPSGAGLHVGHPLGYIASDIYARYKRLKGFNVLHPMGYDAFGLPAEQYAIEHGIHPAVSTENNIKNFRSQLDKIGFCFDWDREVNTSKPEFYKWTQWIFLQLFDCYYNRKTQKAERIKKLVEDFEKEGNCNYPFPVTGYQLQVIGRKPETGNIFTAEEWKSFDELTQQNILMEYRLAYCGYGEVNWCEALGTVLANDEVINGVSERGGYPVAKKKLRQWYLRITEYADRLLEGLNQVDFSEAMKEMQTNWIGKSSGAEIEFRVGSQESGAMSSTLTSDVSRLTVYTTRPDTIFGVDFMVIAPEHELVEQITSTEQKQAVDEYLTYVKSRSERERMAEKKISGVFSGAYCIHPFSKKKIPIWISEYVLIGYGTGAIMAVPCGDERDHKFAKHFDIPITNIIGKYYSDEKANPTKDAILENSDFLNEMLMKDAIEVVIQKLEELGIGKKKVNYKMRDAAFSRQRYWGEPFPIIWKNGIAYPLDEKELPLELPHVDSYKPGPEGEGPLANIKEWALIPSPSPQAEKGAARVPKYQVHTPVQYELAKLMRKEYTEAEKKLWELLRNNKSGVKFRRQHPIDAYIVDFVSLQDKLIVEVDGGYHETEEQKKYDEERTRVLKEIGFKVIRFANEEVIKNPYSIRDKIKSKLEVLIPSPLVEKGQGVRETNTMPGYAGSSWYFLRYMDPHNEKEFCNRKASDYWKQVDLYIGGTEHAVGHLLYSRMWTKFLFDIGLIGFDEPYMKLLNQGMITGVSQFAEQLRIYKKEETFDEIPNRVAYFDADSKFNHIDLSLEGRSNVKFLYSFELATRLKKEISTNITIAKIYHLNEEDRETEPTSGIRIPIDFIEDNVLDIRKYLDENSSSRNFVFVTQNGYFVDGFFSSFNGTSKFENERFYTKPVVEKMSKSKRNVVNPDKIILKYGADTFRMYEMFLGPVEMSKPWDTKGIEGVHRFLKKFWRLFYDDLKGKQWNDDQPTDAELKVLHKAIKKIEDDTERFSFNTAVSAFMIATNELADLKCHKREALEPLLILLTPYAPHICEELWHLLGNSDTILNASFPVYEEKYIAESSKEYPISVNGKLRTTILISLEASQEEVEKIVLANSIIQKWLDGKPYKKIIFVKGKMVNIVV